MAPLFVVFLDLWDLVKTGSGKKLLVVSAMFETNFLKGSSYFYFLVGFGFPNNFFFLVKFNSLKKSDITLNLVKCISAHFWQIKIEFVILFIPNPLGTSISGFWEIYDTDGS